MQKTSQFSVFCLLLVLSLIFAPTVMAKENAHAAAEKQPPRPQAPTWLLGAGGAFSSSPYKKYDRWTPTPIIAYNGKYIYVRGTQGGVQYSPMKELKLTAFLEYDFTNFFSHYSDDDALEHLENRYGSLLAGVGATMDMPFGGTLRASAATNVLSTHSGIVGTLEYDYALRYQRLMITPFVGAKFFSAEYLDYYYGVSGAESARTGLHEHDIKNMAVEPYVGLRINYAFTQSISATLGGSVRFLSPQVLDSPMVDSHKPVTYSLFGGIIYSF